MNGNRAQESTPPLQASPLANYTLPGVINYLTLEFTKLERFKIMTNLEKNEMKYQVLLLQSEINALKFINDKQARRIAELEAQLPPSTAPNGTNGSVQPPVDIPDIDLHAIKESRFQLTKSMREVIQLLKTPTVNSLNHLGLQDPDNSLDSSQYEELLTKEAFTFDSAAPRTLPSKMIDLKPDQPVYQLKKGVLKKDTFEKLYPEEEPFEFEKTQDAVREESDAETVTYEEDIIDQFADINIDGALRLLPLPPAAIPTKTVEPLVLNITPDRIFYNGDLVTVTGDKVSLWREDRIFERPIDLVHTLVDIHSIGEGTLLVFREDSIDILEPAADSTRMLLNLSALNSGKLTHASVVLIRKLVWGVVVNLQGPTDSAIRVFELRDGVLEEISKTNTKSAVPVLHLRWYKRLAMSARGSPNRHKKTKSIDLFLVPFEIVYRVGPKLTSWNPFAKKKTTVALDLADAPIQQQNEIILYSHNDLMITYNLVDHSTFATPAAGSYALVSGDIPLVACVNDTIELFDPQWKLVNVLQAPLPESFSLVSGDDLVIVSDSISIVTI